MMRTEIIVVQNDQDHEEAMLLITTLGASEDPADMSRLRAQALVVAEYGARHWPSEPVTPADILAYVMDQHDLSPADMRPILGDGAIARVSEILAGKKGFSLKQIRRMHEVYGVPADLLIGEPRRAVA
jgi:HTH-type transcriptional regulator / antitoxin HigA